MDVGPREPHFLPNSMINKDPKIRVKGPHWCIFYALISCCTPCGPPTLSLSSEEPLNGDLRVPTLGLHLPTSEFIADRGWHHTCAL